MVLVFEFVIKIPTFVRNGIIPSKIADNLY
jgi:hypothetical protein